MPAIELYNSESLDELNSWTMDQFDRFPDSLPTMKIWEHAESVRVMPPGTPKPGPFEIRNFVPYWIEPHENMSPFSPVEHEVILKGAQITFTGGLMEPFLLYYMGYDPSDIIFISGTEELLKRWASRRLEPAINSYGYRDIIRPVAETANSRRKGDNVLSKEYLGCRMDMTSAQSAPGMRASDKRIMGRDEIDSAPGALTTGEGNWIQVSWVRTNSWEGRRKILDGSTPAGTYEESQIWQLFKQYDQRRYLIPCPHCGKMQTLETERLQPVYQDGELIDAVMLCEFCKDPIRNYHKTTFLSQEAGAHWAPYADINNKRGKSRQISSLYSPVGLLSWRGYYAEYIKAQNTPDGMRSFVNLYEGLPFRDAGTRPKMTSETIAELRGTYRQGVVPKRVLFLTMAVDVQRGSANDPQNPPRLEFEVMGTGAGYRTYSIDYGVFVGEVHDAHSGAWKQLRDWAHKTGLIYRDIDGQEFPVYTAFYDSGYKPNMDSDPGQINTVYQFTSSFPYGHYPSKGMPKIKRKSGEDVDEFSISSGYRRYRVKRLDNGIMLYEINTNLYKSRVYSSLNIKRRHDTDIQPPGFCEFPIDYGDKYFHGLTIEEKRSDGTFYTPKNARNEPLDCRVMNLCAADMWLDARRLELREQAHRAGASGEEIDKIDIKTVIDILKRQRGLTESDQGQEYMK
jgi:phage terminase large subunit GpA-like protein